jgi:hypothetical protein
MKDAIYDADDLQQMLEAMKRDLPVAIRQSLHVSEKLHEPLAPEDWRSIGDLVEMMDAIYRQARIIADAMQGDPGNEDLLDVLELFVRDFPIRFQIMNRFMDEDNYRDAADCLKFELAEMLGRLSRALGDEIADMEKRYEKNMAYLREKFPKVYNDLKDVEPDWMNYQIVFTKSGMPNLKIRTGDRWVRFYSQYDPEAEVARWAAKVAQELGDMADVILYGLGFGYHLLMLSMHMTHLRLSIREPDRQIFIAAMHAIDLESLFSRVNVLELLVGGDKIRQEQMVFNFMKMCGSNPAVKSIPVYEQLNARDILEFCENAKLASMYYVSSMVTYGKYGMQWLQNRLLNLPVVLNTPSLRNFKGLLAGKTAVVVGAGPSLEADIPVLRELKRHALIIAAGSTVQSLLHFGIEPHLIVFMDGGDVNLRVYDNPAIRGIPILFAPMAQHKVIESLDYRLTIHYLLKEDLTMLYLMGISDGDPCFESVPSVTGNAIEAAIYMGCTEIVLVGQDLSYPDGRMYAQGAKHIPEEQQQLVLERATYTLENVSGGLNRATHGMVVTLAGLEEMLKLYPEITFINTTRYGAKINHTRWESLDRVLERLRGEEIPERVIEHLLDKHAALYDEERKTATMTRLSQLPAQLEEFENQLMLVFGLLEQLPELSKAKSPLCIQYMQDIELEWGKMVTSVLFQIFMMTAVNNEIRAFDRDRPELEKETDVERKAELFVQVLTPLIEAMQSCLPELKRIINIAIERVEAGSNQ